jgi:hypothetical protein
VHRQRIRHKLLHKLHQSLRHKLLLLHKLRLMAAHRRGVTRRNKKPSSSVISLSLCHAAANQLNLKKKAKTQPSNLWSVCIVSNSSVKLRFYQSAAIAALEAHWRDGGGPALIEMATATGKSLVIGEIVRRALMASTAWRALIAVHVQELVEQDVKALRAVWPDAPYGICCEGLGHRDHDAPVIIGTIQSLSRDAEKLGRRDLVIVDECFPAGTMVATPFGDQPIESLKPGSAIFNATGVGFVEACRISRTHKLVNLELTDGTIIRCTPSHPIATEQEGWCCAGELERGARVFSQQSMRELRCRLSSVDERRRVRERESLSAHSPARALGIGKEKIRCGYRKRANDYRSPCGGSDTSRESGGAMGGGLRRHSKQP